MKSERITRSAEATLFVMLISGCIETGEPPGRSVLFASERGPASRADYVKTATPTTSSVGAPSTPSAMGGRGAPTRDTPQAGMTGGSLSAMAGSGAAVGAAAAGASGTAAAGTAGAMAVEPVKPAGPVEGVLTVKLTSVDLRGRYSPRNCGAVWVETKGGQFVKTMEKWCGIRSYYLERWTDASGGWGSGRGGFFGGGSTMPSPDQTDAVSAATLRSHVEHQSTWKSHDKMGKVVPDGEYKLVIEVSDGVARSVEFPFNKGQESLQMTPSDAAPYKGLSIEYQPGSTP